MSVRPELLERWFLVFLTLWGVGCLTVEALAAAGLAGCALGAGVVVWQFRFPVRGVLRAWLPLVAFIAWALLAPTLSGRPPSGTGVARTLDFLGIPVAALALGSLSEGRRMRLVWGLAGVLLLSCFVAGLQHLGLWPSREALEPLAWTKLPLERVYEPVPGTEGRFMGGGLVFHRLKFSHVGGLAVAFALGLGLRFQGRRRAVALGVAAVGFLSITLFPFARAGLVALVGAVGLMVLRALPWRTALVACGAVVGLALLTFAVNRPLRERFLTSNTAEGSGDRASLLETGLRAVRAHPLTGWGPGRFQARRFASPDMAPIVREHPGKAHNQYLSMAAETGVPGALLFLVLLVWLARRLPVARPEGLGALGALAFFMLLGLLHDPFFHVQASQAFALVLGAGFSGPPAPSGRPSASAGHSPPT